MPVIHSGKDGGIQYSQDELVFVLVGGAKLRSASVECSRSRYQIEFPSFNQVLQVGPLTI